MSVGLKAKRSKLLGTMHSPHQRIARALHVRYALEHLAENYR